MIKLKDGDEVEVVSGTYKGATGYISSTHGEGIFWVKFNKRFYYTRHRVEYVVTDKTLVFEKDLRKIPTRRAK